jgi:hypothetical protein
MKTFVKHHGRLIYYETGVTAPDGYREVRSDWVCWNCDKEAEYGGYCEAHYNEYLDGMAEDELAERDEYESSAPLGETR